MQQQYRDTNAFHSYRALTEARLSSLLEQTNSAATLDDIKRIIFYESNSRFSFYVAHATALFENRQSTIDIDTVLPVIQDAWNYFPHRALNGQCPAEIFFL